jgi:hypothetical protein
MFIFIVISLNKKSIFVKKNHKNNRVKDLSCEIKYLSLYVTLNFLIFIFIYLQ